MKIKNDKIDLFSSSRAARFLTRLKTHLSCTCTDGYLTQGNYDCFNYRFKPVINEVFRVKRRHVSIQRT